MHKEGSKGCLPGSSPQPPMAVLPPEEGQTAASWAGAGGDMRMSVPLLIVSQRSA